MERVKEMRDLTQIIDACSSIAEKQGECKRSDAQYSPFCYTYQDERVHIAYTVYPDGFQLGVLFDQKPMEQLGFQELVQLMDHVYPIYAKQVLLSDTD